MTPLVFITVMLVGIALSCVIIGTYFWARFALPMKYAPLVIIPCAALWLWLVGYGLLSFLDNLGNPL